MKRNFKYVTLMATALLIGFSSCSNDDDVTDGGSGNNGNQSVNLKIGTGVPSTYADEVTVDGGTAVLSGPGSIFFLKGNGDVDKEVAIVTAGASSQTQVTLADITSATGYEILNISNQVAEVYIVGNVPAGVVIAGLPDKAAIEAVLFSITDQSTVASVSLQGTGVITPTAVSGKSEAHVTLSPIVSRFEIGKIEYDATEASSVLNPITAYQIDGIFLNNVYTKMGLDFAPLAANILYNGPANGANFTAANYPAPLSDIGAPGLGGATLTKTPVNGVWGYQFFPVDKAALVTTALPELVIKFSNIVEPNAEFAGTTQWVTVKQFEVSTAPGVAIQKFERNKIYKIAGIKFANKHLSPVPSSVNSDVTVIVDVKPWETVTVNPVLP